MMKKFTHNYSLSAVCNVECSPLYPRARPHIHHHIHPYATKQTPLVPCYLFRLNVSLSFAFQATYTPALLLPQ